MFWNKNIQRKALVRPFAYIHGSLGTDMFKILILLCIQVVLLFFSKSYSAIFIVISATLASIIADILNLYINKDGIFDNYSLLISAIQGLIAGMFIPETYSVITVFIVTFGIMLVVKHFFGGFSYAWVNPSAFTVVVLWIIGARLFPEYEVSFDLLSMRNPSLQLIENGVFPILSFDTTITDFLNSTIFSLFKVSLPEGYVSMFWDTHSIIPAFRFNFITLISSVFIFSDDTVQILIPAIFVILYTLLVRFVSPFIVSGITFQGDMVLSLFTSGTLFCAVYLIGWYGSTPITIKGKIIYAIIAGILAFLISGCGTSPCGMIFTVLISNVISIIIQQVESRMDRLSLQKRLKLSEA